jgi:DNA-binding protein HU-beta
LRWPFGPIPARQSLTGLVNNFPGQGYPLAYPSEAGKVFQSGPSDGTQKTTVNFFWFFSFFVDNSETEGLGSGWEQPFFVYYFFLETKMTFKYKNKQKKSEAVLNKGELITEISQALGNKKSARIAIDALLDTIVKVLKNGESVKLMGFGTFKVVKRAARKGTNLNTGKVIKIKPCKVPKFAPSKNFKDSIKAAKEKTKTTE